MHFQLEHILMYNLKKFKEILVLVFVKILMQLFVLCVKAFKCIRRLLINCSNWDLKQFNIVSHIFFFKKQKMDLNLTKCCKNMKTNELFYNWNVMIFKLNN